MVIPGGAPNSSGLGPRIVEFSLAQTLYAGWKVTWPCTPSKHSNQLCIPWSSAHMEKDGVEGNSWSNLAADSPKRQEPSHPAKRCQVQPLSLPLQRLKLKISPSSSGTSKRKSLVSEPKDTDRKKPCKEQRCHSSSTTGWRGIRPPNSGIFHPEKALQK